MYILKFQLIVLCTGASLCYHGIFFLQLEFQLVCVVNINCYHGNLQAQPLDLPTHRWYRACGIDTASEYA